MKRNRTLFTVLGVVGLFALSGACGDDSGPGTNNNNNGPVCNHDGVCDANETLAGCPDDCGVTCDSSISGTDHDVIVKELFIPDSTASAKENGIDVDGDGEIDNRLGAIISMIASQGGGSFDVNQSVNDGIASGSLMLIGRAHVDQFGDDDPMFAQVFQGEVVGDATPDFSGLDDQVAIGASSPTDLLMCGRLVSNNMTVGPAELAMVFPIPQIGNLNVTLSSAQMVGTVQESGWTDVMIGGAISKQNIDALFEQLLPWLNDQITTDPQGSIATTALDLLDKDGSCATSVDGCDPLPSGCVEDGVITTDELSCNPLLASALKPDVDLDGDGVDDAISLGLRVVEATPVTVVSGTN